MNAQDLMDLLADEESDRVERTVSFSRTEKFGKAICAFANDLPAHGLPGYLFIGANPDGTSSGVTVDDRLLLSLAGMRDSGNIQPLPRMNVQKHTLNGGDMAVVEVFPSDSPPVTYNGRVWIRVGPRRAVASRDEEQALIERRAARPATWDASACVSSSLDSLALDLFTLQYLPSAVPADVLEANDRPIESRLAALRLYASREGVPTNAAVLLFGKDPSFFVPGARVQFVEYVGPSQASDVVSEHEIGGDLTTALRELDALVKRVARSRPVASADSTLRDDTVYEFPTVALRELIMNAVVHRSYELGASPVMMNEYADRVEILSPGGLHGDLRADQVRCSTAYRNPVLAESLKVLGYVNRFGRGLARADAALKTNGSRALELEIHANHVLARVWRRT